ncbi:MAG: hypothetical protein LBQ54_14060 [Planctomycetaceae bacterium]|nr:hypothetical protein [Planctomycetaceae bacterium]
MTRDHSPKTLSCRFLVITISLLVVTIDSLVIIIDLLVLTIDPLVITILLCLGGKRPRFCHNRPRAAAGDSLPTPSVWSASVGKIFPTAKGMLFRKNQHKFFPPKPEIVTRKPKITTPNIKISSLMFRKNASGQRADAAPRMELPLRSNDPLPLVAGINERKNSSIGSRPRSREASAVQRATLPVRPQM